MEVRILGTSILAIRSLPRNVQEELANGHHTIKLGRSAYLACLTDIEERAKKRLDVRPKAKKGEITHGRPGNFKRCKIQNGGKACEPCSDAWYIYNIRRSIESKRPNHGR